eukprot:1108312-Prorocentrum_minimum.AAC.1
MQSPKLPSLVVPQPTATSTGPASLANRPGLLPRERPELVSDGPDGLELVQLGLGGVFGHVPVGERERHLHQEHGEERALEDVPEVALSLQLPLRPLLLLDAFPLLPAGGKQGGPARG